MEALRSTQLGALPPNESSELCPQVPALLPVRHAGIAKALDSLYARDDYKLNAYGVLGGAVQIPTESYDDLGPVGIDPRWDVFAKFHDYLERTFPTMQSISFSTLEVTKVNTYGIVLRWEGSDPFLYPVLITAHQDVVPVDPATEKDWVHPPYSGYYDGTWIWGRGSGDDKADLIASLQYNLTDGCRHALSALLEQGFKPTRTFVWAFGFDEEASGMEGAGQLAKYLEREFGRDGFAILLDEGGEHYYGMPYGDDVIFATPSLAEKGYIDVRIEVTAKGGHSSVPPPHTAIGVLSAMVVALEAHPHPAVLERGGSPYNSTMCAATYGSTFPEDIRQLAFKAAAQSFDSDDSGISGSTDVLEELKSALIRAYPVYDAVLRTTQAVDLISGGVKVNALPELAAAVVNHRIAQHSGLVDVQAHVKNVILPVAAQFNLTMDAFGYWEPAGDGSGGHVRLSDSWDSGLLPSPVTPTGPEDPYQILAGTIKATLQSAEGYDTRGVVVAPQLALGNTDTQFYWDLTKNIIRYSHLSDKDLYNGLHTVNEAVRAEGWIQSIRFYTRFILNCDEHLRLGNF
ncbi:carboxypeptidase S [Ganoderma leucocontextum]|nr:carboxypeptidase S [Ganoderma leucocontextum]